jgi:hypothetical protein
MEYQHRQRTNDNIADGYHSRNGNASGTKPGTPPSERWRLIYVPSAMSGECLSLTWQRKLKKKGYNEALERKKYK